MRTATVASGVSIGQYPKSDPVQIVARAGGWTLATAKQMLNPADQRCPFTRAALILRGLVTGGHGMRAELLRQPIDFACQPLPVFVDRDVFWAAALEEQEHDGAEDVAQLMLRTPAEWDTYRRRALKHMAATMQFIRVGDVFFGRAS
jgi:hypothetical protein